MKHELQVESRTRAPATVAVLGSTRSGALLPAMFAELDPLEASAVVWLLDAEPATEGRAMLIASSAGFVPLPLSDGARLEAGCAYIAAAGDRVWFDAERLRVSRNASDLHPFDLLLASLARVWQHRAIVMAPEPSSDAGARGIRAVRQAGGQVLAAGVEHPPASEATSGTSLLDESESPASQRRSRSARSEAPPFRMQRLLPFSAAAVARLQLAAEAAARLALGRDRLRAWVPACKTGGLVYGMSMLLHEIVCRYPGSPGVQVFGTDPDEEALAVARSARYPADVALGLGSELRSRYICDRGGTFHITEEARASCVFSTHRLSERAPFSRMDLIVCHRAFVGVPPSRRHAVVEALHAALRDGGVLFPSGQRRAFPADLFEPMPDGYLRKRSRAKASRAPFHPVAPREALAVESRPARRDDAASAELVARDVSELKQTEAALREEARERDEFLAVLGHELRNPLAAIRNAVQLMNHVPHAHPQVTRLQGILERQSRHATQLIDGLLDVSRAMRGKIELELAPVPVVELVRQVVEDRSHQLRERLLELRLPEVERWVMADRVRLVQILDNLLSNALQSTARGGRLQVSVEASGGRVTIGVSDDGVGIEPAALASIFEPFRQSRERSAAPGGLGLGLALVKALAELHGFELAASSAGAGRGASFALRAPMVAAADVCLPKPRCSDLGASLLVVEDDADVAQTLGELLALAGHAVRLASSAEAALELLREQAPDVVLCDLGLPGMDGLMLARRVRAQARAERVKLVALTGYVNRAKRRDIESAGFDRYLTKPIELDALLSCISDLVLEVAALD